MPSARRRLPLPPLHSTSVCIVLLGSLVLWSAAAAAPPQSHGPQGAENIATFSVCAYDPSTGEIGVAVQSKFFAVGTVVPWCKAGVGAVASQAFGNPNYGPRGLALMEQGVPPSAFLPEWLANDGYASQRQIGMVMVAAPPFAAGPPAPPGDAPAETATEQNMTSEDLLADLSADPASKFNPANMPPEIRSVFDKSVAGESLTKAEQDDLNHYIFGLRPATPMEIIGAKQCTVTYGKDGQAITYTGEKCLDWAGGRCGITSDGVYYCVQGNILTGQDVVDAMAAALEEFSHRKYVGAIADFGLYDWDPEKIVSRATGADDLPSRLLYALAEGQTKGGDSRGMQSAALLVSQAGAGYGGYSDRKYDLRVDDAANPFVELARLLNLARPIAMGNEAYNKLNSGDMEGAVALFAQIVLINPEDAYAHYNLACGHARMGHTDIALKELAEAIRLDPKLKAAATGDTDLTSLRELDEFKKLTAEETTATPAK